MSNNDFTRVTHPRIDGIDRLISDSEQIERNAVKWMDNFKELHRSFTIAEILDAMPQDNGECPRDCFMEIYKALVEVLGVVNPDYETIPWNELT